jgi:hypothetical protein
VFSLEGRTTIVLLNRIKRYVLVSAVVLSGCASLHQSLEADITRPWIGAPVDELLGRWGYPSVDHVVANRRVLVWPVENNCHRMAQVDPDSNVVVGASITGEYCPVTKLDPGSAYYLWRRI